MENNIFSEKSEMELKGTNSIAELLDEVEIATENMDEEAISELKPTVLELAAAYPDNPDVLTMQGLIAEAEHFIDCENCREDLKALFMQIGADDYTARKYADKVIAEWHMQDYDDELN